MSQYEFYCYHNCSTSRQSGIRHALETLHVLVIILIISRANFVASSGRPDSYDNNRIHTETNKSVIKQVLFLSLLFFFSRKIGFYMK
jgi:hypothetical protein